jgi:LacI family transcriptional regulator
VEAAYRQMAANASVDAVMVQAPTLDDPRVPLLRELGLPFLVHGRTANPEDYHWMDVANVRAFRRATDLLLDLGHRRIALLNGLETLDFALRRRRGFEEALDARGLKAHPDHMHSEVMTEQYGYRTASALLDREDAPTAFVVSSIISAIGARRAAAGGARAGSRQEVVAKVLASMREPAMQPFLALWWDIVAGAARGGGTGIAYGARYLDHLPRRWAELPRQ